MPSGRTDPHLAPLPDDSSPAPTGADAYSIVVVTWRSAAHLSRLIASMNRHLGPEPELVVVDNASDDEPESPLREWRGATRFLRLDRNMGFGAAANLGVASATHEGVVLLNPDTELVDGRLANLVGLALRRRALAGPRLLNPDGSVQPSASGAPTGPWPWLGALAPGALQPPAMRARTEPWRLGGTRRVAWLSGACLAAPRSALLELGPFDASIHLYGEDMDLGLRAAEAGLPSLLCADVCQVVHHGRGSSSQRYPDGPWEAMAANRRAVLRRRYGPRRERLAWAAQLANLGLRAAAKAPLGGGGRERAGLQATLRARPAPRLGPPRSRAG